MALPVVSYPQVNRYLLWGPVVALGAFWLLAYAGLAPSAWVWAFLRLTGVIGYLLLALSVASGALLSARFTPPPWLAKPLQYGWHGLTAGSGLVLVAVHVALSLVGTTHSQPLVGVLVPGMATFSPFAMGLGTVASYFMLAPFLTFAWRRKLPAKWVKLLHLLAYPAFVAGTLHGVLMGSDRLGWAYLGAVTLVAFTFAIRMVEGRRAPAKAP